MEPIPKMVTPAMEIATKCAVSKGVLKVRTAEEIDELISELIIAKTGLAGAESAIGAQGAMDAAREVEAERAAERQTAAGVANAFNAQLGVQSPVFPEPEPPQLPPCPESCPGHGLSCTQCAPHGLPHTCPQGCQFGEGFAALTAIPLDGAFPEPLPAGPVKVPLADAMTRLLPMEPRQLKGALVDISQSHPEAFNSVIGRDGGYEPPFDGDPGCPARHPQLGAGCEAHRPGVHVAPGQDEGDPDIEWPREPHPPGDGTPLPGPRRERRPAVSAAELAPVVRELSRPLVPSGRHASVTPLRTAVPS